MKPYNIVPKLVPVANTQISAIALGESGPGRVLTFVPCPAEFTYLQPGLTKTNKPRLDVGRSNFGWLARISTEGAYLRGANGNVSIHPEHSDCVKVIARGQGAFGDAGRIGSWDDLLIEIQTEAPVLFRVKPTRGDAYLLLFTDTVSRISYEQADLYGDGLDVAGSTTTSRGDFIRL